MGMLGKDLTVGFGKEKTETENKVSLIMSCRWQIKPGIIRVSSLTSEPSHYWIYTNHDQSVQCDLPSYCSPMRKSLGMNISMAVIMIGERPEKLDSRLSTLSKFPSLQRLVRLSSRSYQTLCRRNVALCKFTVLQHHATRPKHCTLTTRPVSLL